MAFVWCVDERDYTGANERERFTSYMIYNENTDRMEHEGIRLSTWRRCGFKLALWLITIASIAAMVAYYTIQNNLVFEKKDGKSVVVEGASSQPAYYILTVVYSAVIVALGYAQKAAAYEWTR